MEVTKCNENGLRELFFFSNLNHPNIPKIYDVRNDEKMVYYKMKKCVPLSEYDYPNKLKLFNSILETITYLHSRGIYHQNIHPDSILIDPETNIPYLIDFSSSNSKHIVRSEWVDPVLNDFPYDDFPSDKTLMEGDYWSLGILGIYLFYDHDIYDKLWFDSEDGYEGLPADFEIDSYDDTIKSLLNKNLEINIVDPLDSDFLNKSKPWFETVELLKKLGSINLNDLYVGELKKTIISNHKEGITCINGIINKLTQIQNNDIRIKIIYVMYDNILPQCYGYFNDRFWLSVIDKLGEFYNSHPDIFDDLYIRRINQLEYVLYRMTHPQSNQQT